MLKFFNRLEKTRNFVLFLFAVVMVASLVFFYAPTRGDLGGNLARSEETAASVSGETITVGELYRQKEMMARMMQGRPYPVKSILNSEIGGRIMRIEAERLGLTASDAEVAEAIRRDFKSQSDGKPFDQKRYEQNAVDQAGSVSAFEDNIRDSISAAKLRTFISSGVTVSEEDVLKDFQRKNSKFDLSYVTISTADLAKSIIPADQELRDYFEKNKQSYYIGVPQKKIRYVFVNTAKIGEKLPISDADLRAEYDKLPAEKKKAGVFGREIVLRVPKPEFDGQVLEKAGQLVERLKKDGPIVDENVFAELAKGQSESAVSAAKGGELPGPVRENPNNPTDPYQRLIAMEPGEVTEPISYQGRYFILRRGEDVPKPFEDAKKELDVSLRNRRAYEAAAVLAQKITESLKTTKDPQKTAQEFAAQANMSVADMVRETAYVKPGDSVENIGTSPQFEDGIAPLENVSDVGDKIPVQNGFAIPMLADKKEPRDAEFDEVKANLVDLVKLEKAQNVIESIANQIAANAGSASGLAAAAQSNNIKAQESKSFILGSPLGEGPSATTSEALQEAIYGMKVGEVTKTPIKIGDSYFIVGVTNREEANMDDFAKQRTTLMEQMLNQKRGEVFAEYLAATRRRLETAGEIKIYKDAVAKLDEPALPFDLNQ